MKKIVLFSIALCTILAMFISTDANAILVRPEESYFGTLEELYDRKSGDLIPIADWLKKPESLAGNSTFKQVVTATASLTGLKEKRIEFVVRCLNKAMTKKKPAYFEWCTCNNLLPMFRFLTILLQINTIYERFPPETNPEIVHTAFCEGGLLQTYCLIYTLAHCGYQKIHVNVIGDCIINMVHDGIYGMERAVQEREEDGFFPGIVSPHDMAITKEAIKRDFQDIGLKHKITVTIEVYKSAYDYMESIKRNEVMRSHSFDNIDPGGGLDSKVYSSTRTKAKLQESRCEGLAITNYDDLDQVGNVADCSRIEVYEYDMDAADKNEWIGSELIRRFTIIPGVQKYSRPLKLLKDSKVTTITRGDALMLMSNSVKLDQLLMQKYKKHAYFLLVGKDDPSNIFRKLVNRTRVEEVCPVVFEAHSNQIYEYAER